MNEAQRADPLPGVSASSNGYHTETDHSSIGHIDLANQHPATSLKALSINSDSCGDSCIGYSEEDEEGPPLDQRHLNLVHEELEKLNIATDVINKLEVQLDAARAYFREIQGSWSEKLKELSKKYGSAIAKARPYYEAKYQERKLREESQRATIRFERATSLLGIAKQQVKLTQDSLSRQTSVHPECLEVLNHHIQRVNEAEAERLSVEEEHRGLSEQMMQITQTIAKMEKEHRSSIKKSRTYFDQRLEFTRVLEEQKALILRLEAEVRQKKSDYTTSLRNLERISDSIHEQRSLGSARSLAPSEVPANPPPYQPTAPPPYDDSDDRYRIPNTEQDDIMDPVLSMFNDEKEFGIKQRGLGSGVILLAQQLMGSGSSHQEGNRMELSGSQTDVSYRTLPEGLPSSSQDSSEVSSLASVRTSGIGLTDDECLGGMLRSHSALIQEIDGCASRVESMLKRSVSDADESGVGSTHGDN